jgi:hypothetical protein
VCRTGLAPGWGPSYAPLAGRAEGSFAHLRDRTRLSILMYVIRHVSASFEAKSSRYRFLDVGGRNVGKPTDFRGVYGGCVRTPCGQISEARTVFFVFVYVLLGRWMEAGWAPPVWVPTPGREP